MKIIAFTLAAVLTTQVAYAQAPTQTPDEQLAAIQKILAVQALPPDYTPLLKSILEAEKQLLESQSQLIAVEKDTNKQVTQINKTFGQTMASVGVWVGKYVAPAIVTYLAARKLR